ncbi:MAG: flagellar hook assembly protein FlgD [Firmicutes bacterium]|nr:flagellar hook assembly protein FlgD [Bacillota bacterium]NLL88087.1 flagellar hook assembly protein FlgD [Bacillota bacterium]HKM17072.1 flagellar hook assembly protein FlgD [Limnochordia bacterium]
MQVNTNYAYQANDTQNKDGVSNSNKTLNAVALGKDDFLKLLITQLRYQDPTSPVDDKEFIAQLAQFSSLEQMQNLNETIKMMMESQQKLTALGQATAMIGKVVEIYTVEGESLYGKVTGIQFKNEWPEIVVDGKLYSFSEIVSIMEEGTSVGN